MRTFRTGQLPRTMQSSGHFIRSFSPRPTKTGTRIELCNAATTGTGNDRTARWEGRSRAHAFVDNHVVEYADDCAAVAVVVGDGKRCHAGGGTAGRRCGVRPDAVD